MHPGAISSFGWEYIVGWYSQHDDREYIVGWYSQHDEWNALGALARNTLAYPGIEPGSPGICVGNGHKPGLLPLSYGHIHSS